MQENNDTSGDGEHSLMNMIVFALMIIVFMKDESEEEDVKDIVDPPKASTQPVESKSEREEKLRQMMDQG